MNFRSATCNVLTLLVALSTNACLTGSSENKLANAAIELTITAPSSESKIETTDTAVSLAGNASSDMGIFKVSWINDRGGQGVANGTKSWKIVNIALELGGNRITVIAEDNAGTKASRSILVYRETGQSSSATLSWVAPTTRTDGSLLTDLTGYKILYGRISGIYDYQIDIDNPGIVTYVVENLASGDWYFALIAYDSQGFESDHSNEVVRHII